MIKNIVIAALSVAVIVLSVCLYLESKEHATTALKLRNTELNLDYEKNIE